MKLTSLDAYRLPEVPGYHIASFTDRIPGFIIDVLVIAGEIALAFVVANLLLFAMTLGRAWSEGPERFLIPRISAFTVGILALVLIPLYNRVYLISQRGASVGQRIRRLRVVTAAGQNLTWVRALLRLLVEVGFVLIPVVSLVDLLWPISWFNPNPNLAQTLHDKAVGSYVVRAQSVE